MNTHSDPPQYRDSMGRLLMLYTLVDRLIMEICAERISGAPDLDAKLALAKQTGDECRHVRIQTEWMNRFGVRNVPLITHDQEAQIRAHFRSLSWPEFLADLYLCVEALGSEAVERIVPLCDPGTRESLQIPLQDEMDHVAFGVNRLREELARMTEEQRTVFLARIPGRIEWLTRAFHGMGLDAPGLFSGIGVDYPQLCTQVCERRTELLEDLAA